MKRFVPALFCAAILLYGCVRLTVYFVRSADVQASNEALQALHTVEAVSAAAAQTATSVPVTASPAPLSSPSPTLPPPFQQTGTAILPELQKLYAKNHDLIGWIEIPGVVNLPVVYRDNRYYLTHDFSGEKNVAGTLFLDENHPLAADTQALVIHGHNMTDGSMFGLLPHYRKIAYIRQHGLVTFSTLYRRESYAIIAVLIVPEDVSAAGYVAYTGTPFYQTEAEFNAYKDQLLSRSLYTIPIDVNAGDALLTLSTCLNEDRLIVVCRRLRAGETETDMLIALAHSVPR